MSNPENLSFYWRAQVERVEAALKDLFRPAASQTRLTAAMNYTLLSGGKRLRPILCLATGRTLGVAEQDLLPAAVAVELIHCYSLIHDDLPCMDDDDLRRGVPTNHRVYGAATALLAGDALLTYAFEQLTKPMAIDPIRQLELVRIVAEASGWEGMVAGQQADMEAEGTTVAQETQLEYIHVRKTARLVQVAIDLAAVFADVEPSVRHGLRQFGCDLGLAFQITDDWLNATATAEQLGKPSGSDEQRGKLTYPRLIGVEATRQLAIAKSQEARLRLDRIGIHHSLLHSIADFAVNRSL